MSLRLEPRKDGGGCVFNIKIGVQIHELSKKKSKRKLKKDEGKSLYVVDRGEEILSSAKEKISIAMDKSERILSSVKKVKEKPSCVVDRSDELSSIENESVNLDFSVMKELGPYYRQLDWDDFLLIQFLIDKYSFDMLIKNTGIKTEFLDKTCFTSGDYEFLLEKLVEHTRPKMSNQVATQTYSCMPEYYTIKNIGKGDFGKAFLITKAAETDLFQREIDLRGELNGKKNIYVLKQVTYPEAVDDPIKDGRIDVLSDSLMTEITCGYNLSHPNICEFYGAYSTNYFCTLIHEYLCCGVLTMFIESLDPKVVLFYTSQILLALEYLHELNIYHGDIKTENVAVDIRGYAKLIDFGTAIMANAGHCIEDTNGIAHHIARLQIKINQIDISETKYFFNYIDGLNNERKFYELDISGISDFFIGYLPKYFNLTGEDEDFPFFEEVRICCLCGHFTTNDFELTEVPTVKQLRQDKYFESIDFTKLLLRGYDLVNELGINVYAAFDNYSSGTWTSEKPNLIFSTDNKKTFQKRNNVNFLKETKSLHHSIFSNLSEVISKSE